MVSAALMLMTEGRRTLLRGWQRRRPPRQQRQQQRIAECHQAELLIRCSSKARFADGIDFSSLQQNFWAGCHHQPSCNNNIVVPPVLFSRFCCFRSEGMGAFFCPPHQQSPTKAPFDSKTTLRASSAKRISE